MVAPFVATSLSSSSNKNNNSSPRRRAGRGDEGAATTAAAAASTSAAVDMTTTSLNGRRPLPPNNAITASLPSSASNQQQQPYSSLTLSPSKQFAILAQKDSLQVIRLLDVGGEGSERKQHSHHQPQQQQQHGLVIVRSLKITQYLNVATSSSPSATTSAVAAATASGSGSGANRSGGRVYGDVRDAFNLMAAVGGSGGNSNSRATASAAAAAAAAAAASSGGGAANGMVTRVSWSSHHHYHDDDEEEDVQDKRPVRTTTMKGMINNNIDKHSNSTLTGRQQGQKGKKNRGGNRKQVTLLSSSSSSSSSSPSESKEDHQSFVAAAGSNGVILIWNAGKLLFSSSLSSSSSQQSRARTMKSSNASLAAATSTTNNSSSMMTPPPEGILTQHTRAVNALAWHLTRPGLLLSGSQDGTIKLWERRTSSVNNIRVATNIGQAASNETTTTARQRPWFMGGGGGGASSGARDSNSGGALQCGSPSNLTYAWWCKSTFEPKNEAVLDVQWSKFQEDTFAVVTGSGNLIVYNMYLTVKAIVKVAAHTGDATCLDWHPTQPFFIATGGSNDRCVKVWNVEAFLGMDKQKGGDHTSITINSNTWGTTQSVTSTSSTGSSNEKDKSAPSSSVVGLSTGQQAVAYASSRTISSGLSGGGGASAGGRTITSAFSKHVLSISASVTHVRWRPPSHDLLPLSDDMVEEDEYNMMDRNDCHLAVATARQTSAGGSGILSLWSVNRPYMPLSVVEGHEGGAVADFVWLQMPTFVPHPSRSRRSVISDSTTSTSPKSDSRVLRKATGSHLPIEDLSMTMRSYSPDTHRNGATEEKTQTTTVSYIWQHVLSVGRDGRCLLQSFFRGDRPICRVPSSCFAMASLSPFQRGYGSLQCFSVYQNVPNHLRDDFPLTGLRGDEYTAHAPGAFQEQPALVKSSTEDLMESPFEENGKHLPPSPPRLVFSVLDHGDLDNTGLPFAPQEVSTLCIAPELVHLSRFARAYKLYPDRLCPTAVDLCYHNQMVAAELLQHPLAQMWKTVATLLHGCGVDDGLPPKVAALQPGNAMQFAIFPTVQSLLYERADAGDIQTCVALCEVLHVIESGGEATRLPGLGMNRVREWYISYIDLLHQLCLFSAAAFLIKNCRDPAIGSLSQQATSIHESCPKCGKPLDPVIDLSSGRHNNAAMSVARRTCKNCRRRVGMCFICHEPVQGMFVWCPGCGHGGHLEHALQWFGGKNGAPVREVCPTGCGHKCNFQFLMVGASAFPRTDSFKNLPLMDNEAFCIPSS